MAPPPPPPPPLQLPPGATGVATAIACAIPCAASTASGTGAGGHAAGSGCPDHTGNGLTARYRDGGHDARARTPVAAITTVEIAAAAAGARTANGHLNAGDARRHRVAVGTGRRLLERHRLRHGALRASRERQRRQQQPGPPLARDAAQ